MSKMMPGTRVHPDDPRTLIVDSTPQIPTLPDKAEDPRLWQVEWWDTDFLCRRYNCTPDDLIRWSKNDCPLALPEPTAFLQRVGMKDKTVWKRRAEKVREREANALEFAARIPRTK